MISSQLLRSIVLFVLVTVCVSLPYLQLLNDYDNENVEGTEPSQLRQFFPYVKRNIAIGRGDGLRPGK